MIVDPYRRPPAPPTVALLTSDGMAVSEHGEQLDLDRWPDGTRLWAAYETVYQLVRDGRGEALCWNGEEIRWRHRRHEEDWKTRPSDAAVIKLPFGDLRPEHAIRAFCAWRDWLGTYSAAPTGTSGSAAWSLLRACLERRLITGSGERPPVDRTVGGRQELGPAGQGSFDGPLQLYDLPSAYASTLAGLRYGGVWLEAAESAGRELGKYAGTDTPVFVRAQVTVPLGLPLAPLPSRTRARRPRSWMEAALLGPRYPHGRLQGVWTWEEVTAAQEAGCRVRILDGWIHRSGWQPFAPWWRAIQDGRRMPGLAGQLAKITGNALWGRFCMDLRAGGTRTIRHRQGRGLRSRPLAQRSQQWPAHDLAETVSGRVRAHLFTFMLENYDGLVSAHTDGAWLQGDAVDPGDWRLKDQASQLDVLDPQCLRYWRRGESEPSVVYAGVPAERAAEMFERRWRKGSLVRGERAGDAAA
jgi:hypothetical protein